MYKTNTPQEERDRAQLTRYYEQDGLLRAYSNRAMFLAILCGVIALAALSFAIYVRTQPPTVIRVDKDGNATIVGHGIRTSTKSGVESVLISTASMSQAEERRDGLPTDLEGKAVVRRFLEHYLSSTPDSAARNLAEALNMMTANLRSFAMGKLRDDDILGKIQQEHIIVDLRIRSIERNQNLPWAYVVFAVKEIHKVREGTEATDRIVGQYNVRLVEEQRTEANPSGLLVAEYSEKQMMGERDNSLEQKSALDQ